MLPRVSLCQCCGRELPDTQFNLAARGLIMCIHCEMLPAREAGNQVRDIALRDAMLSRATKEGKRKARAAARQAEYYATGKRCSSCHQHKGVSEFDACAPRPDGLQSNCRTCNKLRLQVINQPSGLAIWRTVRDAMRQKAGAQEQAQAQRTAGALASAGLPARDTAE